MEISGEDTESREDTSTTSKHQPKQTTKATQKATSISTNAGGGGNGNSSTTSEKAPPATDAIHVLTTSNGSPYQSE
jgi:hypothetical protein